MEHPRRVLSLGPGVRPLRWIIDGTSIRTIEGGVIGILDGRVCILNEPDESVKEWRFVLRDSRLYISIEEADTPSEPVGWVLSSKEPGTQVLCAPLSESPTLPPGELWILARTNMG
ncbi:hypothetical protein BD779DRAFT_1472679 [Infundibulicybe gibba]|nr:hypothetical protein BD779DRAFT_1472679 [Infundibulicybe gibba]